MVIGSVPGRCEGRAGEAGLEIELSEFFAPTVVGVKKRCFLALNPLGLKAGLLLFHVLFRRSSYGPRSFKRHDRIAGGVRLGS